VAEPLTPLERAPARLAGGRDLWLKREDLHELGAFKWRGALPVVRRLAAEGHRAVVTASTGNHGAAVGWACRELGVESIVFAPKGASATKLELLAQLGADVRIAGNDFDEAKYAAHAYASAETLAYFEDGAEPLQYEAYEAIGSELVEQAPTRPQTVVIPIGNGALAAGVGRAVGRLAPRALRVGVVAKEMPVMADSFDAGKPVAPRGGATIADGLAVRVAIPLAVERLRGTVDRVLRVSERALAEAVVRCADSGLHVEPSAAATIAALDELDDNQVIVVVITGRNVDEQLVARARSDLDSFPT
jgi:threonine dehydratase